MASKLTAHQIRCLPNCIARMREAIRDGEIEPPLTSLIKLVCDAAAALLDSLSPAPSGAAQREAEPEWSEDDEARLSKCEYELPLLIQPGQQHTWFVRKLREFVAARGGDRTAQDGSTSGDSEARAVAPPAGVSAPAGEQRRCKHCGARVIDHAPLDFAHCTAALVRKAKGAEPAPAEEAPGGEHQHDWEWFSWYGEMRRCRDCNTWERIPNPAVPAPESSEELRLLRELEQRVRRFQVWPHITAQLDALRAGRGEGE